MSTNEQTISSGPRLAGYGLTHEESAALRNVDLDLAIDFFECVSDFTQPSDEPSEIAVAVFSSQLTLEECESLGRISSHPGEPRRLLFVTKSCGEVAIQCIARRRVHQFISVDDANALELEIESAVSEFQLSCFRAESLARVITASFRTFMNILALTQPDAFSNASHIQEVACLLADKLDAKPHWSIELAMQMSQVGWMLDAEIAGSQSVNSETDFLSGIPELSPAAEIVRCFNDVTETDNERIRNSVRVLQVAQAYGQRLACGDDALAAAEALSESADTYGERATGSLLEVVRQLQNRKVSTCRPVELQEGDILADDLRTLDGRLVLRKGRKVVPSLKRRLMTLQKSLEIADAEIYPAAENSPGVQLINQ